MGSAIALPVLSYRPTEIDDQNYLEIEFYSYKAYEIHIHAIPKVILLSKQRVELWFPFSAQYVHFSLHIF